MSIKQPKKRKNPTPHQLIKVELSKRERLRISGELIPDAKQNSLILSKLNGLLTTLANASWHRNFRSGAPQVLAELRPIQRHVDRLVRQMRDAGFSPIDGAIAPGQTNLSIELIACLAPAGVPHKVIALADAIALTKRTIVTVYPKSHGGALRAQKKRQHDQNKAVLRKFYDEHALEPDEGDRTE